MRPVHGLACIAFVSTSWCAAALSAAPPVVRSAAFAEDVAADGSAVVVALAAGGGERARRPAGDAVLRFGPAHVVLVERVAVAGERPAALLDGALATVARFGLPVGREVRVGRNSLLLAPASVHDPLVPFDLEFRALDGAIVRSSAIAERRLVRLEAAPGGQWIAVSFDARGQSFADVFAADGAPLYARSLADADAVIAVAESGERAVIADQDGVLLLDRGGGEVRAAPLPGAAAATFDPRASRVALAGEHALAFLDARTGAVLFQSHESRHPLAGAPAAFVAEGERLLVVERATAAADAPLRLVAVDLAPAPRAFTVPALLSAASTPARCFGLGEIGGGRIAVATSAGVLVAQS